MSVMLFPFLIMSLIKSYHVCLGVNTAMFTVSFQSEHTLCILEVEQM